MAEGSARGGRSSAGPLVLAVIFLAVLGAGAGFSLGTLARDGHATASGTGGTGTTTVTTTTTTTTPPAPEPSSAPAGTGAPGGGGSSSRAANRCPQHTEQQANAGPLTQVLYLHTAQSEVWICRSGDGTLFYQGHKGHPGEPMTEGSTALFLTTVQREGGGYVATNTDPASGHVTKYHVTSNQLVIDYTWSGQQEVQPGV